jgi:hypothetical protein
MDPVWFGAMYTLPLFGILRETNTIAKLVAVCWEDPACTGGAHPNWVDKREMIITTMHVMRLSNLGCRGFMFVPPILF